MRVELTEGGDHDVAKRTFVSISVPRLVRSSLGRLASVEPPIGNEQVSFRDQVSGVVSSNVTID